MSNSEDGSRHISRRAALARAAVALGTGATLMEIKLVGAQQKLTQATAQDRVSKDLR